MIGTGLILLGAAARLVLAPAEAEFSWEPAESDSSGGLTPSLEQVRRAVSAGLARRAVAERPLRTNERVDPNAAPAEELERLPGIGPAKALAIVDDRESRGPYVTLEDLRRVPGIGPVVLERIAPHAAGPVDVNTAGILRLAGLPGIGTARAESIVAYRTRNGRFGSVQELLKVPGIGAGVLRGLQGLVEVR
jgi:competence ComEA-like helix-hairpin-helix protein